MIGDNIKVTICSVSRNGQVKVGIDAPKDITILREEIVDQYSNRMAGES